MKSTSRLRLSRLVSILLSGSLVLCFPLAAAERSDEAGLGKDAQTERRDAMLRSLAAKPYPPTGAWHSIAVLMAACHTGKGMEAARAELRQLRDRLRAFAGAKGAGRGGEDEEASAPFTHWHGYLLERIWFLYGDAGSCIPRALDADSSAAICEILWRWAEPLCRMELARADRTWDIWGSENHHLMMWTSLWGAAQILAQQADYRDRAFGDGSTPAQVLPAFEEYFKRYARERAAKGLLVECGSPTYAKYSVGCWYNLADFARDEELRQLFGMLLDVYWADWALDQIDGVRGGSRHRNYPGEPSWAGCATGDAAWYHFGSGTPQSRHPGSLCAATSRWRPDPVVMELVQGASHLGSYVARSRRPGKLREGAQESAGLAADSSHPLGKGVYQLDSAGGELLRYTYRTPDFVLGASLVPAWPSERWSRISSQNRLDGVVFAGHPAARIFAQPFPPKRGSVYNAQWSVAAQGSLILQRLRGSNARGQRVWCDPSLPRLEKDGWVFVQAPRAFAAVRVVSGGSEWEPEPGLPKAAQLPWLTLRDEFAPVILEVAGHDDVAGFAAFQERVAGAELRLEGARLDYASPFSGTRLTLFADGSSLPQVDGKPVELTPSFAYESPFLRAGFGESKVLLQSKEQAVELDFAQARRTRRAPSSP